MIKRAADGVRLGNTLEHGKEARTEALHAERASIDDETPHGARPRLRPPPRLAPHGALAGRWKRTQQPLEDGAFGKGRRATAEEDRLELRREVISLQLELAEQRIDVRSMLRRAA